MSNPKRGDSGRDAIVEEVACLAPDVHEALDRLGDIEELMTKHLAEFALAIGAGKAAMLALRADLQLLQDEVKGDRAEVERRLQAVQRGAERMGYPYLAMPKLRVMCELPR